MSSILNDLVFVLLGVLVFSIALVIVGRAMPGNLWKQALEERNPHAAILLAGIALALGWIVAAAVH
ncbi:MAG TPA: DUF350 domain-containing protein [Bryobacteraceae bacterium]|nr:DUF350 domain-containing protein [Bryobacteraceae bacterium]